MCAGQNGLLSWSECSLWHVNLLLHSRCRRAVSRALPARRPRPRVRACALPPRWVVGLRCPREWPPACAPPLPLPLRLPAAMGGDKGKGKGPDMGPGRVLRDGTPVLGKSGARGRVGVCFLALVAPPLRPEVTA